jgi:hypothetical protein
VELPDSVTTIGGYAFSGCSNLSSINYPKSWTSVGYLGSYYYGYIFYNCAKLESITIPEGVTAIPAYAFASANGLKSVKLPSTLTTIGSEAFSGCTALEKIWIGEKVITIGTSAFYGDTALTIHGVAGTYAEEYAIKTGIPFSTKAFNAESLLYGKVVDAMDAGIPGVSVHVYSVDAQKSVGLYYTNAAGGWECDKAESGTAYIVSYYHRNYVFEQGSQTCNVADEGTE